MDTKKFLNSIEQSSLRWIKTGITSGPSLSLKFKQSYWPYLNLFSIPEFGSVEKSELDTKFHVVQWLENVKPKVWNCLVSDESGNDSSANVFVKDIHLLDPISLLKQEFVPINYGFLPNYSPRWIIPYEKIQARDNQAYVDCLSYFLFSRLREENICPHFVLFYGCELGVKDSYEYKITDLYDSLRNDKQFWDGFKNSKSKLKIQKDDLDVEESDDPEIYKYLRVPDRFIDVCDSSDNSAEIVELVTEQTALTLSGELFEIMELNLSDSGLDVIDIKRIDSDSVRSEEFSADDDDEGEKDGGEEDGGEDDEEEDEEDDEEEDEEDDEEDGGEDEEDDEDINIVVDVPNVPVISVFQEAQDGVLDKLLNEDEINGAERDTPEYDKIWIAWLFQICSALSLLQKMFLFTHNDLHTNNIVWRKTDQKYLFYKSKKGTVWRVPTYGKIFSIIDFGRAILTFKNDMIISDDHWPNNYAGDQYNFGPFYDSEKPEVVPNPSFDLCRLAVSMLDGLYEEYPKSRPILKNRSPPKILSQESGWTVYETKSHLFNILWSWTVDTSGKTIYENSDRSERYPGFELYKRIAQDVKSAIPREQISRDEFQDFIITKIPKGCHIYFIDCDC
jgi:hypothetical protein